MNHLSPATPTITRHPLPMPGSDATRYDREHYAYHTMLYVDQVLASSNGLPPESDRRVNARKEALCESNMALNADPSNVRAAQVCAMLEHKRLSAEVVHGSALRQRRLRCLAEAALVAFKADEGHRTLCWFVPTWSSGRLSRFVSIMRHGSEVCIGIELEPENGSNAVFQLSR